MAMIDDLLSGFQTERLLTLENRSKIGQGDFDGAVAATWVKLDSEGLGVCEYNGKKYKTIRLGDTSLRGGDTVQLTHADGIYFSDW